MKRLRYPVDPTSHLGFQGEAEKGIALLHNTCKDPGYQDTFLGEAGNLPHFGLDAESTEDGVGPETGEEPAGKGTG